MVIGRLLSYWEGNFFRGELLNFGRVFVASDSYPPEDSDNVFLTDPFAPGGKMGGFWYGRSFFQLIQSSNQPTNKLTI